MAPPTRVCVTGASAGVGYECARQLALQASVKSVVLACRNPSKAKDAKAALETSTGKNCFEILILDICDLESVKKAVDELQEPIDGLILNAGGFAGQNPTQQTENGTMRIFDLNVLGSVNFTDLLLDQKKLSGHVLYVSSETCRGIKGLNSCHEFVDNGSVEEMKSLCDGTFYKKSPKDLEVYGRCKLVGTLWTGSMARNHPNIRFIAVSPGNTSGTNVVNNLRLPAPLRVIARKMALPMMVCCGRFHPLPTGAKRYMDVLFDEKTYETGHFYGSERNWPTGPMADQILHLQHLYNEGFQDNANAAIHSFLRS